MDNHAIIRLLIFLIIFLAGLYFYAFYKPIIEGLQTEGFKNKDKSSNSPRCPNILIQKDAKFYLYNSEIAQVPGVNPISFNNLEEYVKFLEWQRSVGIRCPVLYVQNSYNAQGQREYKIRPSVTDLQGGIPPSSSLTQKKPVKEMDIFSEDNIPAVDVNSNAYTNNRFDNCAIYNTSDGPHENISPDPMDPNWGGAEYTQSLVDAGYYADNEVSIAIN